MIGVPLHPASSTPPAATAYSSISCANFAGYLEVQLLHVATGYIDYKLLFSHRVCARVAGGYAKAGTQVESRV